MIVLYLMSALEMLNMANSLSTLTPYIKSIGGSNTYIGVISSSAGLLGLIWNPIIGSLSDSVGQKNVAIKCLGLGTVAKLLMCIYPGIYTIFASQVIFALASPVNAVLKTVINDIMKTPDKKSTFNTKNGIISASSFMVGAWICGLISEFKHGFYYNFVASTVFVFLELILAFQLPDKKVTSESKEIKSSGPLQGLNTAVNNLKNVNWSKYKTNFTLRALMDVCNSVLATTIGLVLATKFNIVGREMSKVFILGSMVSILSNVLMLKKLKKTLYLNDIGFKRVYHGTVILTVAFLGMFFTRTMPLFLICIAITGASRTIVDSSMVDAVMVATTKEDQGSVISAFGTLAQLTGFVIPALCGIITETIDVSAPYLFCVPVTVYMAYIAYQQKAKAE